ncbi:ATP-binding cassette subfamily B protein/ATP-binding cassette subfamily C protein [Nocardiopsis sp. Huas11]|uniref:ABC transporter ATP-binding protein n=1 Tax=Nocardiopsis sp. Huas11 TaxID=2183912 RepID=UPI000EB31F64|nr:ABC transporter ATP-binding protein [Nocardiopsis sp. Huas11]RKS08426.1 ATP-binding cassette subfamily B protein/ATP-binding cassette subfamily C protein [Nocardiopsis sp. Huas11]
MKNVSLRPLRTVLRFALEADKGRTVLLFTLTLLEMCPVAAVWALKVLVDALSQGESARAVTSVVAMAALLTLGRLASHGGVRIKADLTERTGLYIDRRVMSIAATLPELDHHERAEYRRKLEMLRFERAQLVMTLGTFASVLGLAARALLTMAVLFALDPLLVLLPLFAVPAFLASRKSADLDRAAKDGTLEHWYQANGLLDLATSSTAAKELRVFALHDELPRRFDAFWRTIESVRLRARLRGSLIAVAGWAVFCAGFGAALATVLWRFAEGTATAGDLAAAVAIVLQLNGQVGGLVGTVGMMHVCLRAVGRLDWLENHARTAASRGGEATVPDRLREGITLHDVSFSYPDSDRNTLDRIGLRIRAGTTVAIVGENGAGKTTLVKLLFGLYQPTSGRITADTTDIRDLDPAAWRAATTAAFQDFERFELPLGSVVGIGDLPRSEDEAAIRTALERAGATEVPGATPDGLATRLGSSYPDGSDLSGGQWQKLALARALMRPAPLLTVFDEPTANLDPVTEKSLFDRYAAASRESARTTGGVTVLVTHRFSTVRSADVIVVMDHGRLVETGSHTELMEADGMYAELYRLQARAYL